MTPGSAAAFAGWVAFRAPGVCPAPPLWLWAQYCLASFPGVRVQSHAFIRLHSGLFGAVSCFVSAAPVCVGCILPFAGYLGPCSCASVLCCWSALIGWLSVLECAFWGFLLLLALLHLFPLLCLFVTPIQHFKTIPRRHGYMWSTATCWRYFAHSFLGE